MKCICIIKLPLCVISGLNFVISNVYYLVTCVSKPPATMCSESGKEAYFRHQQIWSICTPNVNLMLCNSICARHLHGALLLSNWHPKHTDAAAPSPHNGWVRVPIHRPTECSSPIAASCIYPWAEQSTHTRTRTHTEFHISSNHAMLQQIALMNA